MKDIKQYVKEIAENTNRVTNEARRDNEVTDYEYDIMREKAEFNLFKMFAHDEALQEHIREQFEEA